MNFLKALFSTPALNNDPKQRELADLIVGVVDEGKHISSIFDYLEFQGWPRNEAGNRVTHAVSMLKVYRADIYPQCKTLGVEIYKVL